MSQILYQKNKNQQLFSEKRAVQYRLLEPKALKEGLYGGTDYDQLLRNNDLPKSTPGKVIELAADSVSYGLNTAGDAIKMVGRGARHSLQSLLLPFKDRPIFLRTKGRYGRTKKSMEGWNPLHWNPIKMVWHGTGTLLAPFQDIAQPVVSAPCAFASGLATGFVKGVGAWFMKTGDRLANLFDNASTTINDFATSDKDLK